jgi:CDGSH-type Zn-finger protein
MSENTPTIQISKSGKISVTNGKDIILLDSDGNEIPKRNRFSLCNCGMTNDFPFCDGSHNN